MITENVKKRSGTSETKVVLYFHTKHLANRFIDSEPPVRNHFTTSYDNCDKEWAFDFLLSQGLGHSGHSYYSIIEKKVIVVYSIQALLPSKRV